MIALLFAVDVVSLAVATRDPLVPLVFMAAVVVHEAGHYTAARAARNPARVAFWPGPHCAVERPSRVVAAAGPAASVLLAAAVMAAGAPALVVAAAALPVLELVPVPWPVRSDGWQIVRGAA